MNQPLVTFGIINCNRLHYLRSCFESLLLTTEDYPNKEIIIIDNASTESGTTEYLDAIGSCSYVKTIIKRDVRDPSNEFAKGLNTVCELAKGDIVVPLQGDMQFITKGWLNSYANFVFINDHVGCLMLDAQRRVTLQNALSQKSLASTGNKEFVFDLQRPPLAGAGDVMFKFDTLKKFLPWYEKNLQHEGGNDSETDFLIRSRKLIAETELKIACAMPIIPCAAAIYTDLRGTNARVRGNRRYGDYWASPVNSTYYDIRNYDELLRKSSGLPMSIEELVITLGFPAPIDKNGNWLKNPIKPELATPSDWVELDVSHNPLSDINSVNVVDIEIENWLNS